MSFSTLKYSSLLRSVGCSTFVTFVHSRGAYALGHWSPLMGPHQSVAHSGYTLLLLLLLLLLLRFLFALLFSALFLCFSTVIIRFFFFLLRIIFLFLWVFSVNPTFLLPLTLSSNPGHLLETSDVGPWTRLRLWDIRGERQRQRNRRHHQSLCPQTRQFRASHHRHDQHASIRNSRRRLMDIFVAAFIVDLTTIVKRFVSCFIGLIRSVSSLAFVSFFSLSLVSCMQFIINTISLTHFIVSLRAV